MPPAKSLLNHPCKARSSYMASGVFAQVDKYVKKVLSETPAHVEEVIIEKDGQSLLCFHPKTCP